MASINGKKITIDKTKSHAEQVAQAAKQLPTTPKTTTPAATKTTKSPTSTSSSTTIIKKGATGTSVSDLQKQLGVNTDGIFGPQTDAAVRLFQSQNGLTVDGIVGPETTAALAKKNNSQPQVATDEQVASESVQKQPKVDVPVDTALEPVPDAVQAQTAPEGTVAPGSTPTDTGGIPASLYSGSSIVDYLASVGQPNDYASRKALAQTNGIPNYTGTASQNAQLLTTLRNSGAGSAPVAPSATNGATAGIVQGATDQGGAVTTDENGEPIVQKSQFQQDIESIMKEFGIEPPSSAQSPQSSFSDTYEKVYKELGGTQLKNQYSELTKQFGDLQDEKTEKILAINNDPWLTEGVRQNRLKKLDQEYQLRESNLLDRIKFNESTYDNLRQDAQFITGGIMDQVDKSQALTQDIIMKAIDIAESRAEVESKQSISDEFGTGSIGEYNFAKSQGYTGSFTQYQNEDANRKARAAGGGSGGLTPNQINSTVNGIAGSFDNEPIVKAYNTTQEGYQTIQSIGVSTKSPADDIAFIYAFAKIMDPNSVVREGEYNTIQKYAQTWANNFGFSAQRVFSNTNFLTPGAKQKMLNALKPKIDTIEKQYNNVYGEYQRQINDAYSGKPRQITNYQVPVQNQTIAPIPTDTPVTKSFLGKIGEFLFGDN